MAIAPIAPATRPHFGEKKEPKSILLSEPDRAISETVREVLGDEGYRVAEIGKADEAHRAITEGNHPYGLLIASHYHSNMQEATLRLLKAAQLQALPTIFMTAHSSGEFAKTPYSKQVAAMNADVLYKPVSLDELCTAVEKHKPSLNMLA